MIVYLIGMPAGGKTTVGKQLAKRIKYNFVDLDDVISAKENKSITQIFQEKGETYFRELESKCLSEVPQIQANTVVSLGGGTPCFYNNMDLILSSGIVFYINAPDYIIISRIKNGIKKRPLFVEMNDIELNDKINLLLKERESFYLKAHHKIDIINKSAHVITTEISKILSAL